MQENTACFSDAVITVEQWGYWNVLYIAFF